MSESVTVAYREHTREILYRPEQPLQRIATDATRAFGLKFAANAHLRLHTAAGKPLDHTATAKRARVKPGAQLTLKPPTIEGT
jgi:hypothetical protein